MSLFLINCLRQTEGEDVPALSAFPFLCCIWMRSCPPPRFIFLQRLQISQFAHNPLPSFPLLFPSFSSRCSHPGSGRISIFFAERRSETSAEYGEEIYFDNQTNAFLFYAILPLLSISEGRKERTENLTAGKLIYSFSASFYQYRAMKKSPSDYGFAGLTCRKP